MGKKFLKDKRMQKSWQTLTKWTILKIAANGPDVDEYV